MAPNENTLEKLKVAVLYGGTSAEREVSIDSGKEVSKALSSLGHQVIEVDVGPDTISKLKDINPDVAFIALHGPMGEDGTIQGMLETMGIKYTGSGILASALGMDKYTSKKIFQSINLPIPDYKAIEDSKNTREINKMVLPLVVKPSNQGSSVGVSIVKDKEKLSMAIDEAFKLGPKVIVERYIKGREIQCGILGNTEPISLEPIEIISKNDFFDFESKYDPSLAEEIVPAQITAEEKKLIQELSIKAYKSIGCRGFARVDNFLTEDGQVYVSEVNTIPGLTANSLFPKEAKASGYSFEELIQKIIDLALE